VHPENSTLTLRVAKIMAPDIQNALYPKNGSLGRGFSISISSVRSFESMSRNLHDKEWMETIFVMSWHSWHLRSSYSCPCLERKPSKIGSWLDSSAKIRCCMKLLKNGKTTVAGPYCCARATARQAWFRMRILVAVLLAMIRPKVVPLNKM